MKRTKQVAIVLLFAMCLVGLSGCLRHGKVPNLPKKQGNSIQPKGSYLLVKDNAAFRIVPPEGWAIDGVASIGIVLLPEGDEILATAIAHSDDDTLEEIMEMRVAINKEYDIAVAYGTGPTINGQKTMWRVVDGAFEYIMQVPHNSGYLLLEVEDETGADPFSYLQELADSVLPVGTGGGSLY